MEDVQFILLSYSDSTNGAIMYNGMYQRISNTLQAFLRLINKILQEYICDKEGLEASDAVMYSILIILRSQT